MLTFDKIEDAVSTEKTMREAALAGWRKGQLMAWTGMKGSELLEARENSTVTILLSHCWKMNGVFAVLGPRTMIPIGLREIRVPLLEDETVDNLIDQLRTANSKMAASGFDLLFCALFWSAGKDVLWEARPKPLVDVAYHDSGIEGGWDAYGPFFAPTKVYVVGLDADLNPQFIEGILLQLGIMEVHEPIWRTTQNDETFIEVTVPDARAILERRVQDPRGDTEVSVLEEKDLPRGYVWVNAAPVFGADEQAHAEEVVSPPSRDDLNFFAAFGNPWGFASNMDPPRAVASPPLGGRGSSVPWGSVSADSPTPGTRKPKAQERLPALDSD